MKGHGAARILQRAQNQRLNESVTLQVHFTVDTLEVKHLQGTQVSPVVFMYQLKAEDVELRPQYATSPTKGVLIKTKKTKDACSCIIFENIII